MVSHTGSVYSLQNKIKDRPFLGTNGYLKVSFRHPFLDDVWKEVYVHQMVAELFVPHVEVEGLTVNHKDGNKLNNDHTNLEWLSNSDNMKHAHSTGLIQQNGEDNHSSKLTEDDVLKICSMLDEGKYSQYQIAETFNVDPSTISYINTGRRWNHITQRKEKSL